VRTDIVFTLTGPDRVGIVQDVTEALLTLGGNVETSRMARLGGAFAILMLVSLPAEHVAEVDRALRPLVSEGYKVTVEETAEAQARAFADLPLYRIEVQGADHEGIIHDVAAGLSRRGINIESMETGTSRAPQSGTSLFSMTAIVAVPLGVPEADWRRDLAEAAHQSNVDIDVAPAGEA
jgi:glycine cleavage system transcriptional repressor